jgi:hypothetical protein
MVGAMPIPCPPPGPAAIPLRELPHPDGPRRLTAVVDELTLTYDIVEIDPRGRARRLREYIPTLREARAWAHAHVDSLRDA